MVKKTGSVCRQQTLLVLLISLMMAACSGGGLSTEKDYISVEGERIRFNSDGTVDLYADGGQFAGKWSELDTGEIRITVTMFGMSGAIKAILGDGGTLITTFQEKSTTYYLGTAPTRIELAEDKKIALPKFDTAYFSGRQTLELGANGSLQLIAPGLNGRQSGEWTVGETHIEIEVGNRFSKSQGTITVADDGALDLVVRGKPWRFTISSSVPQESSTPVSAPAKSQQSTKQKLNYPQSGSSKKGGDSAPDCPSSRWASREHVLNVSLGMCPSEVERVLHKYNDKEWERGESHLVGTSRLGADLKYQAGELKLFRLYIDFEEREGLEVATAIRYEGKGRPQPSHFQANGIPTLSSNQNGVTAKGWLFKVNAGEGMLSYLQRGDHYELNLSTREKDVRQIKGAIAKIEPEKPEPRPRSGEPRSLSQDERSENTSGFGMPDGEPQTSKPSTAARSTQTSPPHVQEILQELRKGLPKLIDRDTRLESVDAVGNGVRLTNTLVNHSSLSVNPEKFTAAVKPTLIRGYCARQMEVIRARGTAFTYTYSTNDGVPLPEVTLAPNDCSQRSRRRR